MEIDELASIGSSWVIENHYEGKNFWTHDLMKALFQFDDSPLKRLKAIHMMFNEDILEEKLT
ncbi:hypothetical protein LCGC14_0569820 [marine sediment metagenome]|uniref:Uncharacterized protein n=1 Tax=marine sediment metagenome TaxID=412755 RepID=A0A0F9RJG8_9ZZZZ